MNLPIKNVHIRKDSFLQVFNIKNGIVSIHPNTKFLLKGWYWSNDHSTYYEQGWEAGSFFQICDVAEVMIAHKRI
jgi:hypothetical protein